MCCQKSSEACPKAQACRHGQGGLEGFDPACVCRIEDRPVALCLQVQARRAGRTEAEDPGHLPDTGALRLCDGRPVNPKRIYRLYKEMDLQLRNKTPKRRVKAKLRADRTEPTHSNHVWAMDFVHE